jgi:hypothetical protein
MFSSAQCSSQLSEDLDSSSSLGVFGGGRYVHIMTLVGILANLKLDLVELCSTEVR